MLPPSEFLIHTLLSTGVPLSAICPSWPASVSHSFGVDHVWKVSVFLSNLAMALWYITPIQGLSSLSISRLSVPTGKPFLVSDSAAAQVAPARLFSIMFLRQSRPAGRPLQGGSVDPRALRLLRHSLL